MEVIPSKQLIAHLRQLIDRHGDDLTSKTYQRVSDHSINTIYKRFGSWEKAKRLALKYKPTKQTEQQREYTEAEQTDIDLLARQVKELRIELRKEKKKALSDVEVRRHIFGLAGSPIEPPGWLIKPVSGTLGLQSVPAIQVSDIHGGESINPSQVFGLNEYNTKIMLERLRLLTVNTVDVFKNHIFGGHAEYPGIVVCLNGDLVSGTIHNELTATNDYPIGPAVMAVINGLAAMIREFANEFGRVMVFCTSGNHGRTTMKPVYKDRAWTTFDWLICADLEKHFSDDDRIKFHVSDGMDCQFSIFNQRYRQTHGDQFRGGTGFVGHLAPVIRGEHKKKLAATSYKLDYDTLIMGHFHQYTPLDQTMVNGSVVGYNEFSIGNNFRYEMPRQAAWLTHPKWGITFRQPIYCCEPKDFNACVQWVSWDDTRETLPHLQEG